MKNKLSRPICLALALTLGASMLLGGCGDKLASSGEEKKVVMQVGGEDVEYQEFRYYFMNNKRELYGEDAALDSEQLDHLMYLVEENIKNRHTLLMLADEYDVDLSDDEEEAIDSYVDDYREGFEDDDAYLDALHEQYITHELFHDLASESTLAYSLLEKMEETGVIKTDDAAIDAAFRGDDIICIKEIYIYYPNDEARDVSKKRADEVYERLMAGESFEDLMLEYSSYSPEQVPIEHGYYTMHYDALDEVWNAAEPLAVGEISSIVESEFGFHIIMKCEKDLEYMNEHRDEIVQNYAQSKFYEEFYKLYNTLDPEFTDYGSKLDLAGIE